MIGLVFRERHSIDIGLFMKSIDRTVRPGMVKNELLISGRHGSYRYPDNTFENRLITVQLTTINRNLSELRQKIRDAAYWLTGEGRLIFDDEPDKFYDAKIYQVIGLEQIATSGSFSVVFDCQPFTYSAELNVVEYTITNSPQTVSVSAQGTHETSPVITIANTGSNTISGFRIANEYRLE